MSTTAIKALDVSPLSSPHAKAAGQFSAQGSEIASSVYAGLYTAQSGGYFLWSTPDWNSFVDKFNSLSSTGLTLVSVDTNQEDATATYYTGCWTQLAGSASLWRTADWSSFMAMFNRNASSMRLLDFDIHSSGGARWYTGTWGSTSVRQTIVADLGWDDFVAQWNKLSGQGMRLTKIQAFQTSGAFHMTGLFEQGNDGHAFYKFNDWTQFYQKYQEMQKDLQLVDFQVYDDESARSYIGVWRQTSSAHQFVFGLDWGSFVNQWNTLSGQGLRLQKAIRYANNVQVPGPQWEQFFRQKLGSLVPGYAYYVLHKGQVVSNGVNFARLAKDAPETKWTIDTRINLASVSKSICAVAVLKLLNDRGISVDSPFYQYVKTQFPKVGANVDKVTIRNLLEMKSGMTPDGTLYNSNYWTFLSTYLQNQVIATGDIGKVEAYSNTNFTILQAVVDSLTGHGGQLPSYFPTYVTDNVLKPMGIDTKVFNISPDPQSTSTLSYNGPSDPNNGIYWQQIDAVGAGGWISSARELAKFLAGVRNNTVINASTTRMMFEGNLGWYTYNGIFGEYFHHNGGLWNGAPREQGLKTGIIHLSDGYDALLLMNDFHPDTIGLMIQAFESR